MLPYHAETAQSFCHVLWDLVDWITGCRGGQQGDEVRDLSAPGSAPKLTKS